MLCDSAFSHVCIRCIYSNCFSSPVAGENRGISSIQRMDGSHAGDFTGKPRRKSGITVVTKAVIADSGFSGGGGICSMVERQKLQRNIKEKDYEEQLVENLQCSL